MRKTNPAQKILLSPVQLQVAQLLLEHGALRFETRDLTNEEKDFVAPRVSEIERIDHVLAATKIGDSFTSGLGRRRRDIKREIEVLFFEKRLCCGIWHDERGRVREYATATIKHARN